MKTEAVDESFDKLVDDIFAKTGQMPFIGDVMHGPTLEELRAHLFAETERTPLTFTVSLPQLNDEPHELLVMVNGMFRYGKSLAWWKLLGLYLNGQLQFQRVGIHYNSDTRTKGKVILDPHRGGNG